MHVDFNKVFKSKPEAQFKVPPELVSYLSRTLPDGLKYVVDDSGDCVVVSEGEPVEAGGLVVKLTDEQKEVLGKNFTQEDIIKYLYNIQKPIPLSFEKDNYIFLNGQEFPIEKLIYNPMDPSKYVPGSLFAYPSPFPDPFEITVGCEKYERTLLVSRVPNNSVHIAAYETSKEESLYAKYFHNEKTNGIEMNLSLNLKNAKTVRDIVESAMIYNAYIDGKGILHGKPFNYTNNNKKIKRFDDRSALFWEKVLQIEEFLNIEFSLPLDDIDFGTACLVEQLYQNLINKIPVRDQQTINSLEGNWNSESDEKKIKEAMDRPLMFEFQTVSQIELFGVDLKLPTLMCIFGAIFSECITSGDNKKIIVTDAKPEKPKYTSVMCFKTEEDLKKYRTTDHNQIVKLFHDAKNSHEYLAVKD